jgi:hypothetical protein
VSIESALAMLGRGFNDHDFTGYDLDARFPDVFSRGVNSSQSATLKIAKAVEEENLTLRQVALRFATPRGDLVGTPEQIADKFELWLESRASDGFVIGESLPGQFQLLVEQVVPLLQKRGIFREDYEGATFRREPGHRGSRQSFLQPEGQPRRGLKADAQPLGLAGRLRATGLQDQPDRTSARV